MALFTGNASPALANDIAQVRAATREENAGNLLAFIRMATTVVVGNVSWRILVNRIDS